MLENLVEKVNKILSRLFGSRNERLIKTMLPVVIQINGHEEAIKTKTDEELRAKTEEFRKRIAAGETLDELLPEAFAVVREASRRAIGLRHYDVQFIGGMALHRGMISEMITGEGKTLVATGPSYLNALAGNGVHIVTVNDYLARRDVQWMGPIYHALGLTVGCIQHEESFRFDPTHEPDPANRMRALRPCTRKEAYLADITYGTNNEFGFDYLRDNMRVRKEDQSQRTLHYAIIDEADNILIDEARTPLIISGPSEESTDKYRKAHTLARQLKKGVDYEVKEKEHSCILTEDGIDRAERLVGVDSFYTGANMEWPHHIEQSLKAKELMLRDKDYVVKDGEIIIVDEFTGRLMPGRRWSDGLHQAVEAKEGLVVKEENQTLATVTLQNLFRMYKKIAGMTGTAATEAMELDKVYGLEVLVIPPNRILIRHEYPDVVFRTKPEKHVAIIDEIVRLHRTGRPVLVGTTSIENSERVSDMLNKRGVIHEVLNAKHHEREAHIVSLAGQLGRLTISTNMAGRGTDILLGKFSEPLGVRFLTDWLFECHGLPFENADLKDLKPEEIRALIHRVIDENASKIRSDVPAAEIKATVDTYIERGVAALGGLHVLGTERHEARRIDNQLRGRAGRQGDPGASQFILSLEDELLRIFAPEWVSNILHRLGMTEGQPIESAMVSNSIRKAQKKMEEHNFEIRKNLLEYDGVMNEQRKIIYGQRQEILQGKEVRGMIFEMIEQVIATAIDLYLPVEGKKQDYDHPGLAEWGKRRFGVALAADELAKLSPEELEKHILAKVTQSYVDRETTVGAEVMRMTERYLLLDRIDVKWKDHLATMESLRSAIGLRSVAQIDPKVAYKREGYELFESMLESIRDEVSDLIFKIRLGKETEKQLEQRWQPTQYQEAGAPAAAVPAPVAHGASAGGGPERGPAGAPGRSGGPPPPEAKPKPIVGGQHVGRNDPCPCGSGLKFKKCHGADGGKGRPAMVRGR